MAMLPVPLAHGMGPLCTIHVSYATTVALLSITYRTAD